MILFIPMKKLPEYIVSAFIMMTMLISGLIFVLQIPVALRNNPVTILSHSYPTVASSCPGDLLPIQLTTEIDGLSVIQSYISIIDESGMTVAGTERTLPPRPYPDRVVIRQTINFIVPDLSTGSYKRVTAIESVVYDSEVIMLVVPFTVSPTCGEK